MKYRKVLAVLAVIVFAVALAACGSGGGKYAAEKKIMKNATTIMTDFAAAMDKANSGKEVAAVLNQFADKLEKIAPQMKELEKKYPKIEEAPEELSSMIKDVEAQGQKMMGVMMKIMKYKDDPDVKAAQEKLDNIFK